MLLGDKPVLANASLRCIDQMETAKGPESWDAQESQGARALCGGPTNCEPQRQENSVLLRLCSLGHQEQLWATSIFLGPSAERMLVAALKTAHPPSFSQLLWALTKPQAMAKRIRLCLMVGAS